MLRLHANNLELIGDNHPNAPFIARVSSNEHLPTVLRRDQLFLSSIGRDSPPGFRAYLGTGRPPDRSPAVALPSEFSYLADGDVIRLDPKRRSIRVLYRRGSAHNSLLLTERCNNYCLMCSQPPKDINDSWLVEEAISVIRLADRSTREIGLTGGEPTLLGPGLIKILQAAKSHLPTTSIHILSNGRLFADPEFAQSYAAVDHFDLMVGIPIYSDLSHIHDYVVQADGAFDETIRGIINLKRLKQKVEIRVVLHKQTYSRLPQLAEFLTRNLTFVDHVALMGLELTGFTLANLKDLWIDPFEYRGELRDAVEILTSARMNTSVYNHQLCLLDPAVWPIARRSISDWKNEFIPECDGCRLRGECGGFFSSAIHKRSSHIAPL